MSIFGEEVRISYEAMKDAYRQADLLYMLCGGHQCSGIECLVSEANETYVNNYLDLEDYVEDFGNHKNDKGFICDQVFQIFVDSKTEKAYKRKLNKLKKDWIRSKKEDII